MTDTKRKHPAVPSILISAAVALAAGGATVAAPPDRGFLDARVEVRSAEGGLRQAIEALEATGGGEAQWVAWMVPAVDPERSSCCWNGRQDDVYPAVCNLESGNHFMGRRDDTPVRDGDLRVLVRLKDGGIDRVAAYSAGCGLNAGGLRVTVLEGVQPEASVRLLEGTLAAERGRRRHGETLMAIAGHAGPAADEALERSADRDSPRELREQAAFWSGESRGARGLTLLRRMLRQERDGRVLEQVVFGISLSDADGAGELLLDTARKDDRPEVRKRALFWLAQRAGDRAVEPLGDAVRDDPDAEVREQAVFALSQLPDGRGVPLLIELARNNRHPEVRKRAMFWLGESGDPRALELFEEILGE